MRRIFRRMGSCQAGTTAVEFAIVGMVLILVVLGVIEFGRGLNIRNQLSFAADFAARMILTNRDISDSDLESKMRSIFNAAAPEALQITFGTETVNGVQFRIVSVSYPFVPLVPGTQSLNLSVARRTPLV